MSIFCFLGGVVKLEQIRFRPLFANDLEHISKMFEDVIAAELVTIVPFEEHHCTIFINRFPLTNLSEETQKKLSDYFSETYKLNTECVLVNEYIYLEIERNTGICTVFWGDYIFTFNEGPLLETPISIEDEPFIQKKHLHIARCIERCIHFTMLSSPLQQTKKAQ